MNVRTVHIKYASVKFVHEVPSNFLKRFVLLHLHEAETVSVKKNRDGDAELKYAFCLTYFRLFTFKM